MLINHQKQELCLEWASSDPHAPDRHRLRLLLRLGHGDFSHRGGERSPKDHLNLRFRPLALPLQAYLPVLILLPCDGGFPL